MENIFSGADFKVVSTHAVKDWFVHYDDRAANDEHPQGFERIVALANCRNRGGLPLMLAFDIHGELVANFSRFVHISEVPSQVLAKRKQDEIDEFNQSLN